MVGDEGGWGGVINNQVPKRRKRREEEGEERERERRKRKEGKGKRRERTREKKKKQGRGTKGVTYGQVPHYHGERVVVDGTELSSARVTWPTKRVLRGRGRTFRSLWCYMFIAHTHMYMYMDWEGRV